MAQKFSKSRKSKYRTMMFGISVSFLITSSCVSLEKNLAKKPNTEERDLNQEIDNQKLDYLIEIQQEYN